MNLTPGDNILTAETSPMKDFVESPTRSLRVERSTELILAFSTEESPTKRLISISELPGVAYKFK